MAKKYNRIFSLVRRTLKDIEIFFNSTLFACKYLRNNNFKELFYFRKAIEIEQVSPLRNILNRKTKNRIVKLKLPQFGNVAIDFDLEDKFQMAICEEFIKYKIYNLSLIKFKPDYAIDCGTYRGYFTFLLTEKFSHCKKICIEPHPDNYKKLIDTAIQNQIELFSTYNNALSKEKGTISLELWGSNLSKNEEALPNSHFVDIPTIDLDDILFKIKKEDKLVLKMDIEGSELEFFPSCINSLPTTCAVYLETHDGWNSLHNIKKEFEKNGFSFTVLRERSLYIDSFAQRC